MTASPTLHWLEASGTLGRWKPVVAAEIASGWEAAEARATLPPVDALVQRGRDVIPEIGMGGWNYGPNLLRFSFDPDNPRFAAAMAEGALRRLVVHELAHAVRCAAIGWNHNLADALAAEGLCGHFVAECLGTPPEPWECALTPEQIETWLPRARDAAEGPYDHAAWFYGRGRSAPPRWAGYALGYLLVGRALAGRPASACLGEHAARLLRDAWDAKPADT
ncbi:MAG: DUF2268 domain-containing protein [Acetobacteraceae bacterium]|nr:DUF2268 domain-containing protein [Acetobacteraceae bacterium]